MNGKQLVITYAAPNVGGSVTLCRDCAEAESRYLGEVEHGGHLDYCDRCYGEWRDGEWTSKTADAVTE